MKTFLFSILLFCIATIAHAAAGSVDGVQSPAWLDRNNLSVPLNVGMELLAGDVVRTGAGARALLKLPEGSFVKLGEKAQFKIESAKPVNGVYKAALSVVEGAFRFTTQALSKSKKRDVSIRVGGNATIGIRGTDLWGRGRGDKDIVCLLEGKIDVTGNDNKTLRLDQPRQFFQSTRTAPPEPLGYQDAEKLKAWAAETDIEPGKGASSGGLWKVVIGPLATHDSAMTIRLNLRANGFPVEMAKGNVLQIANMSGEAEAKELAGYLKAAAGYQDARAMK